MIPISGILQSNLDQRLNQVILRLGCINSFMVESSRGHGKVLMTSLVLGLSRTTDKLNPKVDNEHGVITYIF
jgi:hypothetical protein